MRNNITLVGINFYPEESSSGLYSTQMAEHLPKITLLRSSQVFLTTPNGQYVKLTGKNLATL